MTIAVTIVYTLLQTILELLISGVFWIAQRIVKGVMIFDSNTSIFETFVNLIPGAEEIHLVAIIEAFTYGLLSLLFIISVVKAIASPLTQNESDTPIKAAIRVITTIFLLIFLFGFGKSKQSYKGALTYIGLWFSKVLSSLDIASENILLVNNPENIVNGFEVAGYLAAMVIMASIMVTVISAAVTHIQRCVSLGLSIIFGPIFVAMNVTVETQNTCKQWMLSILTQFLAIFISMFLWIAFYYQMQAILNEGSFGPDSLINLAIALALINLMKSSEKILNSFGLRTIENGDSARSLVAGVGSITSGLMMYNSVSRNMAKKEGGININPVSGNNMTSNYAFNEQGNLAKHSLVFDQNGNLATDKLHSFTHTAHPFEFVASNNKQNEGIGNLSNKIQELNASNALDSATSINSKDINEAMGWSSKSNLYAIGDADNNMKCCSLDNEHISGVMGDVIYSHNDTKETLTNAYIPLTEANKPLSPGTSVGFDASGNERFIESKAYVDNSGNTVYRTLDLASSNTDKLDGMTPKNAGDNIDICDLEGEAFITYPAREFEISEDE